MKDLVKALFVSLFMLGLAVLAWFYGIFAQGFVITKLWQWFLVPHGFEQIRVFEAAGIALLLTYMTGGMYRGLNTLTVPKDKRPIKEVKDNDEAGRLLVVRYGAFFLPWLVLFVGWFIHLFT